MPHGTADETALDLGAVRWRFPVQPLGFDAWLAMQKRICGGPPSSSARQATAQSGTRGWRAILSWIALVVFFLAIFQFASPSGRGPSGFLHELRNGCVSWLSVGPIVIAIWIFFAGMLAMIAIMLPMQRRTYRQIHKRSGGLAAPTELVLAENGFRFIAPNVDLVARWAAVSDEFEAKDTWFVVIDGTSAAWTQVAALGAEAEAIRAFVRAKAGLTS